LSQRYRLEKRLRTTSDVETYLAYDALLHRPVTAVIPRLERVQSVDEYQAFSHRHQVASELHHRNIVAILDIGEDHNRPYVVSEPFVGDTLTNIIEDEAPFVIDDVAILIEQLARGLDHAYKRGIVHGAFSPENVIIDAAGLAKIVNLGMIEGQYLSDSASREVLVSNPYLPGGLQGNSIANHSLDVHSLAAIAYEMLAGDAPCVTRPGVAPGFTGKGGSYVHPSQTISTIPERAGDVVLQGLMAYDHRSGLTATQFSQALTNWRSMTAVTPAPVQRPPTAKHAVQPAAFSTRSPSWPVPVGARAAASSQGASTSKPRKAPLKAVRWLFLAVVIISIAAIWTLGNTSSAQDAMSASAVPEELLRLFQAVDG